MLLPPPSMLVQGTLQFRNGNLDVHASPPILDAFQGKRIVAMLT